MRSLDIDIRFDGNAVRVKKASGVAVRQNAAAMEAMLRLLWDQPENRHHVEAVMKDRRLMTDLYIAYLRGKLNDLPAEGEEELEGAKDEWIATFQASERHKNACRGALATLIAQVRHRAKVSDLPMLLETYRRKCVTGATPRMFNYAKQACLAFVRDKYGKRHPLRTSVADVPPMQEVKNGVKGLTVAEARVVSKRLLEAGRAASDRIWRAMYCTGMGPTEFYGEWSVEPDHVLIRGTKRLGRRWGSEGRKVPLIVAPVRPEVTVEVFRQDLRVAGASPYQGRKTFTRLMETAQIPRTRRILYLGHGVKDVTFLYEAYEITAFLAEDRDRLLKQLGPDISLQISRERGLVLAPMAKEA